VSGSIVAGSLGVRGLEHLLRLQGAAGFVGIRDLGFLRSQRLPSSTERPREPRFARGSNRPASSRVEPGPGPTPELTLDFRYAEDSIRAANK
jgi:hypothetical protein